MSKPVDFDLIRRAFAVFDGFDGPPSDGLWWRTDGEYSPITLMVNCNDLFVWGCADLERLDYDGIDGLEQAIMDATKAGDGCREYGHLLWVSRRRGLCPQEPYFKCFPQAMHALFRACGNQIEG